MLKKNLTVRLSNGKSLLTITAIRGDSAEIIKREVIQATDEERKGGERERLLSITCDMYYIEKQPSRECVNQRK